MSGSQHCNRPGITQSIVLCATFLLFASQCPGQGVPQNPPASANKANIYFPQDAINGFSDFYSSYLNYFGEPSLLAAAQDPRAHSYRLDWTAAQHWHVLMLRLSLNPDGSAKLTCLEQSKEEPGKPAEVRRSELSPSNADVQRFLQLVGEAGFWSMPALEQDNSTPSLKAYKTDASPWVFEGVRDGHYHVVLRFSPESSPFTDMVRFLAKEIAKLDEPAIPRGRVARTKN